MPMLLLANGCGEADDDRPDVVAAPDTVFYGEGDSAANPEGWEDDVPVGPCKHEAKRECKVTLKVRNGIRTCAVGEQRCEGGKWSECGRKSKDEAGDAGAAAR